VYLQTSRDDLDEKLNLRKKQLHVLFTALHQLQSSMDNTSTGELSDTTSLLDISGDSNLPEKPLVDLTQDAATESMDCS